MMIYRPCKVNRYPGFVKGTLGFQDFGLVGVTLKSDPDDSKQVHVGFIEKKNSLKQFEKCPVVNAETIKYNLLLKNFGCKTIEGKEVTFSELNIVKGI